jgi:hypothetical protein
MAFAQLTCREGLRASATGRSLLNEIPREVGENGDAMRLAHVS